MDKILIKAMKHFARLVCSANKAIVCKPLLMKNRSSLLKVGICLPAFLMDVLFTFVPLPSRLLVSASQDGKLIIWDSYTTNKVKAIKEGSAA